MTPFEGIQVTPGQRSEVIRSPSSGLHTTLTESGLEPVQSASVRQEKSLFQKAEVKQKRRICGLRSVTFWLLLIIAVLVLAGAVDGGVGGALASKRDKSNSSELPG